MNNSAKFIRILDQIEYAPVSSKVEEIIHASIRKSVSQLGKTGEKAVIRYICSMYGLSEKELLTNFDLFEKAITDALGPMASKIILSLVKKEILRRAVLNDPGWTIEEIKNPDLSIREIISRISYEDIRRCVRGIPVHSHSVCLYETTKFRDLVISSHFENGRPSNISRFYISEDKPNIEIPKELNHIPYKQISDKPSQMVRNIFDLIKMSGYSDKSPEGFKVLKIAEEDAGWWLRNGFEEELQILEELLGRELEENVSIMCAFDVSKLSNKEIELIIPNIMRNHKFIITEVPLGLYTPLTHTFLRNELSDESTLK